jgi:2-oxoglutarate ferredoxin oxidoreductase subunit beta
MNETTTAGNQYLSDPCVMPFCKGCGHTHVVRKLDEALRKLQLDPAEVCLVSDIGCIGLVDSLFSTPHTVHTTHGRSTAFATGIELVDGTLADSRLKTIVMIGDGGAMIGLLHLVNAALLNVDVTVILCNNFLFGMTGGQNSAFSPLEFITPTTPKGNLVPPMDICKVMVDAHAEFVAREVATSPNLPDVIASAIEHPGFALVEVLELCTEYGIKFNTFSGNLQSIVEANGQTIGILKDTRERSEFGKLYTSRFTSRTADLEREESLPVKMLHNVQGEVGIIVAGSAGERVQSAAAMFCDGAVRSGLHCTLKTDNPVTQGSGFSLAEIKMSPEEIFYTGNEPPAVAIAVSSDGMKELTGRGVLNSLTASSMLIVDESVGGPRTEARTISLPLRSLAGPKRAAGVALALVLVMNGFYPKETYLSLLECKHGVSKDDPLAALEGLLELVGSHK